jgi:hypothetical protein
MVRWNDPPSATDGDYAHYLLHAKALAEGRPYTDIGYIYTKMNLVGPRAQPPGWPLVLAPFVAVFGTHSPVFKVLMLLLVAAFGVAAGAYFVRRGETIAGFAAAAAVPIALETQYATSSALSDPLFCLLVWLTLLVADGEGPLTWKRVSILTLLAAATISVRVAGIALLPALVLHVLLRRREGGLKALVPVAVLLAVAVAFVGFAVEYIPFLERTFQNVWGRISLSTIEATYRTALATGALYPFASNVANDTYHVLVAVPLVVGAVLFFMKQWRSLLSCFTLSYVVILVLSPVREPRYTWPLMPLLMVCIVNGLLWLGNRFLPGKLRPSLPRYVLAFAALATVSSAAQLARKPPRPSLLGDPDTMALFDWVRTTGHAADMRVVFTNPRVLTLETDVPAMGIPVGAETAVLAELDLKGITHVVVPRHPNRRGERDLRAVVGDRPSQFPAVFSNATHDVRRFLARPQTADSGSTLARQQP